MADTKACPAFYLGMVYKHLCGRELGHPGAHRCSERLCEVEWIDESRFAQLSDNNQPEHK